jgi:type I restriction enzyme M protein
MLHIIRSLKSDGRAAVILPHGILFRGNAEETIRKNILKRGYIKAIIGLPANLFYGTGIPACIIILDKAHAAVREGIFMIDASAGFIKDGPMNRLREMDVRRIVDAYQIGDDIDGYARFVPMTEILEQDHNLNLSRYIASKSTPDIQDIDAHLRGGIPNADIDALQPYWEQFRNLRQALLSPEREGYLRFNIASDNITETVLGHADYKDFKNRAEAHFQSWEQKIVVDLKSLGAGMKPKQEIAKLAEDLLCHYRGQPLIDPYEIFQSLMVYWEEVLSDDFHQIAADGWTAEPYRVVEIIKQGKKKGQEKDVGWTCDLLPKSLLAAHAFSGEHADLEEKQTKLAAAEAALAEMVEEQSGEDGFFADFGKVNKQEVNARITEIKGDTEFADELSALREWIDKTKAIAILKKELKDQDQIVDTAVLSHYTTLTETEIKNIVVREKWMVDLKGMISDTHEAALQHLSSQLRDLGERYDTSLPQLQKRAEEYSDQVELHLKSMGFAWN